VGPGSSTEPAARPLPPTERIPPPPKNVPTPGGAAAGPVGGAEEPAEAAPEHGEGPDATTASVQDSDLAPTLPRSRAAEYAALGEGDGLPPTLPPGVITGVEDSPVEEPPVEEAGEGAAKPLDLGEGSGVADEEEDRTPAEIWPDLEAARENQEEPPAAPVGGVEEAPGAVEEGGIPDRHAPLSSATLAELYFQQGLLERAVEVYRQVLEEEPGNARARSRLGQIEALVEASAAELPHPPEGVTVDPATRRRALERAIERLEALLAVVQRR
jgi:hypothetical protein